MFVHLNRSKESPTKFVIKLPAQKPVSTVSLYPLCSVNCLYLFVPWARTAMDQHHDFPSMDPFFWNDPLSFTL